MGACRGGQALITCGCCLVRPGGFDLGCCSCLSLFQLVTYGLKPRDRFRCVLKRQMAGTFVEVSGPLPDRCLLVALGDMNHLRSPAAKLRLAAPWLRLHGRDKRGTDTAACSIAMSLAHDCPVIFFADLLPQRTARVLTPCKQLAALTIAGFGAATAVANVHPMSAQDAALQHQIQR